MLSKFRSNSPIKNKQSFPSEESSDNISILRSVVVFERLQPLDFWTRRLWMVFIGMSLALLIAVVSTSLAKYCNV